MRLAAFLFLALSIPTRDVAAFSIHQPTISIKGSQRLTSRNHLSFSTLQATVNDVEADCGCASTIFSGKPSDVARASNPRESIRKGSIYSLDAQEVVMDDLLKSKNSGKPVSIVVFLRSLG